MRYLVVKLLFVVAVAPLRQVCAFCVKSLSWNRYFRKVDNGSKPTFTIAIDRTPNPTLPGVSVRGAAAAEEYEVPSGLVPHQIVHARYPPS